MKLFIKASSQFSIKVALVEKVRLILIMSAAKEMLHHLQMRPL